MGEVAVARLRLRSPPDQARMAAHRLEDALRLAPDEPERLLLIRRLALGRIAADARPQRWHDRAARALADQGAHAVHGADSSAAAAGAVWFRSAAEARAILLRELAAGRRPTGWFWRLAVPDWDGGLLDVWLPRWIARTRGDPRAEAALARAVIAVAEAGHLPTLMRAAAFDLPASASGASPWVAQPATVEKQASTIPKVDDFTTPGALAMGRAEASVARLSLAARAAAMMSLARLPRGSRGARWVARMALLAAAPELAFSGEALEAAAEALTWIAHAPVPTTAKPPERSVARTPALDDQPPPSPEPPGAPAAVEAAVVAQLGGRPTSPERPATPRRADPAPALQPWVEQTSRVAGVFLLIRALARLGLPEWLADRPDLAAEGFARALLHTIAARMGAPPDDPALAILAREAPRAWAGDLTAWRVGLDRWLRRTAQIRLADVVRRRGALLVHEDVVEARFRLALAEVRLRRRALDLDPHWTPWLGLSVRYHYRDEPLR